MRTCSKIHMGRWSTAILCLLFSGSLAAQTSGTRTRPAAPGKARPADLVDKVYGPLPPPPTPAGQPVAIVENPKYDWGEVFQGEIVEHTYKILNKGSGTLQIPRVSPGCGCTTVHHDKEVPPGGTGNITLKVDTKNYSSRFSRSPLVETNDPNQKRIVLGISGAIKKIITIEPPYPRMEVVPGGPPASTTVTIKRGSPSVPFSIVSIIPELRKLEHKLETVTEGSEYRLTILTPENLTVPANVTSLRETFRISVTGKGRSSTASLPVYVTVKQRITMVPRGYVFFRLIDVEAALGEEDKSKGQGRKQITLKADQRDTTFKITKASVLDDDGTYRLSVETVKEGTEYKVWVEILKRPTLTSGQTRHTAKAEILTDSPHVPKLNFTIYAVFAQSQPLTRPSIPTRTPKTPTTAR